MLNGCRTESLMAISSVSLLPHRVAACCSSSLQRTLHPQSTALPIGPARTPPRELHYSAFSFDIYALALGMHSGQRPAHGHPLLFMGIRGRNEARTLKRPWSDYCYSSSRLRNSGCRGGVPPHGVQVVGRTVRASKQQPIQFKKLSQTIRPFICECMLDYRALECWLR